MTNLSFHVYFPICKINNNILIRIIFIKKYAALYFFYLQNSNKRKKNRNFAFEMCDYGRYSHDALICV